jgi:hypothetical protein
MGLIGQREAGTDLPRRPIATAIFWLLDCIIDGFATYGHAMHPTFLDADGIVDHTERPPQSQSHSLIDAPLTEEWTHQGQRVATYEYSDGWRD